MFMQGIFALESIKPPEIFGRTEISPVGMDSQYHRRAAATVDQQGIKTGCIDRFRYLAAGIRF